MIPPDPSDPASSILELDELWSNARAKDEPDLGLDCTLPLHPPSHRLCDRRPQPTDLSPAVGSHSSSIPSESLLYRLLGSLPSSATRGTAYGGRPRKQAKRLMWNAGTTPCGNALLALSAKHSLFQNRASCMRPACASFSTATTLIELSCLCEALPVEGASPSLHGYGMGMMKHRASRLICRLFQLHFRKTRYAWREGDRDTQQDRAAKQWPTGHHGGRRCKSSTLIPHRIRATVMSSL
jgi:hypothetical protein